MEARCRFYRRVLDRNPDNLSIWMKYGHSRKEMGNFGEAESAYRAAAARNTSSPEPRLHLGHILKMQGRQQEAEATYLQVIGLHTSNPEALSGLESLGWSERQLTALAKLLNQRVGLQGSDDQSHAARAKAQSSSRVTLESRSCNTSMDRLGERRKARAWRKRSRSIGASEVTYYRGRQEFGGLKSDQVKRLKTRADVIRHSTGSRKW